MEQHHPANGMANSRPTPLPYLWEVVRHLKAEEPDLWRWFSSTSRNGQQVEAIKLDLLKTTYRLEPDTQPKLHALAQEVLGKYGLSVPLTIYQAQGGEGVNAFLAYLPGEPHLVLTGPILAMLSEMELQAMLAHELAHFILFEEWQNEFFIARELLRALANDASPAPAHVESARRFSLYAEVFADRGSHYITGNANAAITTLIKLETGLNEVSAASYLRQAEEIFKKSEVKTDQLTHPEPYIRARALQLWAEQGEQAQADIQRMIEGSRALDRLDLLGQKHVAGITRHLLHVLLAPSWFRTETVLAHARLFFTDFTPGAGSKEATELAGELKNSDAALKDYYCYVLLDFVTVDRELGDTALAAALVLSRRLELHPRFSEIAQKELSLGKKVFAKIDREADNLLTQANEAAATS